MRRVMQQTQHAQRAIEFRVEEIRFDAKIDRNRAVQRDAKGVRSSKVRQQRFAELRGIGPKI